MVAVVVIVVVLIVVVAAVVLPRRRSDPVDSFRRQIDALSPEARRPTISQAKPGQDAEPPAGDGADDEPDDDVADEDGDDDGT